MAKAVVVDKLIDNLPFQDALTWERFQALCTDVLYKRYDSVDSREYLLKGSKQQGIDAYSIPRGEEKMTVAQCKLKEYIGPAEVLEIVDEFLRGNLVNETKEFILCTSADLGRQRDEEKAIAAVRAKLRTYNIDFIVWDERGLSKELRTNASDAIVNIVYRYFNEEIALAFYGDIWTDYVKKLRKVKKHKYRMPLDYIERDVVSYADSLAAKEPTLWDGWNRSDKITLSKLTEASVGKESKKIVLLSTAGFGKTEELKMLAGYFSAEEKLLYPVTFSLRDYDGQTIETILLAYDTNWKNIEEENLLLLFDGLDEVSESQAQKFINHLNAFVEQNPKSHVVISSRYNFYDVKHPQLRGFEIYLLKPLTFYDIENYLTEKLGSKKEDFKTLLEERNFTEYANSPYYLTRFVRFYQDKLTFPKNKTDLFNRILFERLEKDESRYNIPELKEQLLPVAKQIAFCMTLAGKSSLSDEEMRSIISNQETKKLLNHFGILNRNATAVGSWSFEHKNLQEYLCASVFAQGSFVEVHQVVASKFNSNKLQPRFLNTISFLFELIEPKSALFQELFTWLNKNEAELLVRFEKEQLSRETRLEIFKRIFGYYKAQKITLRASTNFSHEELAHFVEVDESLIEFIADEVKSGLVSNLIYDAVSILERCERPFRFRHKLTDLLFSIVRDQSFPPFVKAKAITAFVDFGFHEVKSFEEILASGVNTQVYEIRKALISFLYATAYFEEYSQFILKSIPMLEDGQRQQNSSMSFTVLKELVLKFESPAKVKEIFQYCLIDPSAIDRHQHYREFHFEFSEVKTLLEKATVAYKTVPSILPIVYRIYCRMEYLSIESQWLALFKAFFENTCGSKTIFLKFYRYDKRQRDIMSFADEWCCDFLISEYKAGKILDDEITMLRNVLSHVNWDLFLYFHDQLKDLAGGKFTVDTTTNYNEIYKKQEEKNQLMLLDQNLFLEEADVIFGIIAKDNIVPRDLWFYENKELRKYQNSIVLNKVRDFCVHDDDKMITKEQFFEKYRNSENWQWLVINSTVALLKDKNKQTSIHPDLLLNLEQWCRQKVETLSFENAIKDKTDRSYTFNRMVEFVKDVFLLLHLDLDDSLLLKMLPADHESFYGWNENNRETIGSVVVEQVRDKELLHRAVIENIKKGNLAILVLCSHFTICHKMGYKECLSDLYQCILSHPYLEDYNRVKLTEYYLDLGGEITDFTAYLAIPDVSKDESAYSSWQWYLLEKLQNIETEKATAILLTILNGNSSKENRLKAAEHLIQLSRIEGLAYWAAHIKKYKEWPFEHKWASLQPYIVKLPAERAISLFLSVMEFAYESKLQDGFAGYYFIEESIYGSLINLAQTEHRYYTEIKASITDMISKFAAEPFVDSIKFYSERFTQRYFEGQKVETDVPTANLLFQEVFQPSL